MVAGGSLGLLVKPAMQGAALATLYAALFGYFVVTIFYQPAALNMRMSVSTNEVPHLQSSYPARMHNNVRWVK